MQLLEFKKKEVPLLECNDRHEQKLIASGDVVELELIEVLPSSQVPAIKGTIIDIYA